MSEIEAKLKQAIGKLFRIDAVRITRETSFEHDLDADSLRRVELIMEVESLFGVSIPDGSAAKTQTVGQLIDLIDSVRTR